MHRHRQRSVTDGVADEQAPEKANDGAIGYVELAYALQNNLPVVTLQNAAGEWVTASYGSTTAAFSGVDLPDDMKVMVTNSSNPQAYPISSQTFLDTYQDLCKGAGLSKDGAAGMVNFLDYVLGEGQNVAKQLSYAPLPSSLLSASKGAVADLQCNGAPAKG